jgi:hypothetical protein
MILTVIEYALRRPRPHAGAVVHPRRRPQADTPAIRAGRRHLLQSQAVPSVAPRAAAGAALAAIPVEVGR